MTLLLIESYEHIAAAGYLSKWHNTQVASVTSPQTITGRTGKGARTDSAAGNTYVPRVSSEEHATFVVGFALKYAGLPSSNSNLITFYSDASATTHVTIASDNLGVIRAYRGTINTGTLLGTASETLSFGSWRYIEAKVTLSDTVGVVQIRLDSVSILNLTSQDTKNAGTKTVFDAVSIGTVSQGSGAIDDVYILNGAGAVNNDFLGDIVVECLTPTSDGANTGLTPSTGSSHFALVDEIPENTTDYNSSSVADTIDTYGMSNMVTAAGTIAGVQVTNYAQKDISGLRKVAAVVRSGGTNYAGDDNAIGIGFLMYPDIWETDPATAAAWTIANVNAVEAGAKVR